MDPGRERGRGGVPVLTGRVLAAQMGAQAAGDGGRQNGRRKRVPRRAPRALYIFIRPGFASR